MMNAKTVRIAAEDVPENIQKRPTCSRNIVTKVHRLVIASEIQAQKIRPTALPMLATPTIPAATTALTLAISCNIGDSCEMIEMPAEVFRNKSAQSAHHCHVFRAPASV